MKKLNNVGASIKAPFPRMREEKGNNNNDLIFLQCDQGEILKSMIEYQRALKCAVIHPTEPRPEENRALRPTAS